MDVKAVEFSTPPEFEGPVKEEEYTGEEKLERVASPVPTEVESSNVEDEFADNDVGVAESLLGCREELKYGAETEDEVLKLKLSNEEGEVEKDSEVRATYKDLHAKVWSLTYINTLYFDTLYIYEANWMRRG